MYSPCAFLSLMINLLCYVAIVISSLSAVLMQPHFIHNQRVNNVLVFNISSCCDLNSATQHQMQPSSTLIAQVNLTNLLYAHIVSCVACMWVAQPLRLIPLYKTGLKKPISLSFIYLSMAPSTAFRFQYLLLTYFTHNIVGLIQMRNVRQLHIYTHNEFDNMNLLYVATSSAI